MASKRDIKKDILFFIEEVLMDCIVFQELHPDKEYPEVEDIIDSMEELYSNLIYNVNHIPEEEKKSPKKHFDKLYMHLFDSVHDAFGKLSKIVEQA